MTLALIAFVALIVILLIDLYLYLRYGYEATITCFVRKSPLASFTLGLIVGGLIIHLYF